MNNLKNPLVLLNRSLIPVFTKVHGFDKEPRQELLTVTESRTYWVNDSDLCRDLHRSPNGSPFRHSLVCNLRHLAGLDSNDECWVVSDPDTVPVVVMAKTQRIKPEVIKKLTIPDNTTVYKAFCELERDFDYISVINYDTGEVYTHSYGDLYEPNDLDNVFVIEAYKVCECLILRV